MTAKTNNDKNRQRQEQKQIPFGDDNQKGNGKTSNGENRSNSKNTTSSGNTQRQEQTGWTDSWRDERALDLLGEGVLQEAKYLHASCGRGECGSRGT
jgi:hypothetical protein